MGSSSSGSSNGRAYRQIAEWRCPWRVFWRRDERGMRRSCIERSCMRHPRQILDRSSSRSTVVLTYRCKKSYSNEGGDWTREPPSCPPLGTWQEERVLGWGPIPRYGVSESGPLRALLTAYRYRGCSPLESVNGYYYYGDGFFLIKTNYDVDRGTSTEIEESCFGWRIRISPALFPFFRLEREQ